MFEQEFFIRYSQTDETGKLSPAGIIAAFQDCCMAHADSFGLGPAHSMQVGRAWLLSNWNIEIRRRPASGETVVVGTVPYKFNGFFGSRSFVMKSQEGEILAVGDSRWLYFDAATASPTRPRPDEVEPYALGEKIEMEPMKPHKLRDTADCTELPGQPVRRWMIDTNHHMNNCRYVELAAEYLPAGFEVKKLAVEYRKAARIGDILYPFVRDFESGPAVMLCSKEGERYAVVEFEG